MMGGIMIGAIFLALVFGVLATGPECHVYEGIQPICIGGVGKSVYGGVSLALVAVAIYAATAGKRRKRAADELKARNAPAPRATALHSRPRDERPGGRPGVAHVGVLAVSWLVLLASAWPVLLAPPSSLVRVILAAAATLLVFGGALALIAHFGIDRDAVSQYGPLGDRWNTKATFPDKLVHALAAYALTFTLALYLPVWVAVGLTIAAGVGLEFVQGYVSKWDIVADVAGAGVAVGVIKLLT